VALDRGEQLDVEIAMAGLHLQHEPPLHRSIVLRHHHVENGREQLLVAHLLELALGLLVVLQMLGQEGLESRSVLEGELDLRLHQRLDECLVGRIDLGWDGIGVGDAEHEKVPPRSTQDHYRCGRRPQPAER
jgi:hypothetical protein